MIDGVDEVCEYVSQFPGEKLIEQRVHYGRWVPKAFGTLDAGVLTETVVRIIDLKYGKGVQAFAEYNYQLMIYALGVIHDYDLYDFKEFILTIHQPRLEHVDEFKIGITELLDWAENYVKPIAARALLPGAEIKAGDHCMFCPAKATCKTREEYVMKTVLNDFENLDSGEREVLFLSNEEIGLILPKLAGIKNWCGAVAAHARSEVAKGTTIPNPDTGDYKMVEGRSTRVWKNENMAIAGLALEVEDTDAMWEPKKLLSPAKAEKVVGKGELDYLIHKPKGSPVMVPGTDKRETLEIKSEDEFEDLEND